MTEIAHDFDLDRKVINREDEPPGRTPEADIVLERFEGRLSALDEVVAGLVKRLDRVSRPAEMTADEPQMKAVMVDLPFQSQHALRLDLSCDRLNLNIALLRNLLDRLEV